MFRPEDFLKSTSLKPDRIWNKGEPRSSRPNSGTYADSGLNILVSAAGLDDFMQQIAESISFLRTNEAELVKLTRHAGIDEVVLDFGVAWDQNTATHTDSLPGELIRLLASLGLRLEITHYAVSEPSPQPGLTH